MPYNVCWGAQACRASFRRQRRPVAPQRCPAGSTQTSGMLWDVEDSRRCWPWLRGKLALLLAIAVA